MPKFRNGLAKVGKVYHYCFRIKGEQFKGSTRAMDRATAEAVLAEKRKEALLGPKEPVARTPTMRELAQSWAKSYRSTFSSRHIDSVEGFAEVWINPAMGDTPIDKVTTQAVLDLRQSLLDAGRSMATANLLLRILKLLMSHGVRLGHLKAHPFKVAPLRIQKKPRTTIPASRVAEFFQAIDAMTSNTQIRAMFRMMVGLGLRSSEVRQARWEWVDLENRTYTVGKAKGKEARVLPIPEWLWKALEPLSGTLSAGWIFPAGDSKPHGSTYLIRYIAKLSKAMHLPKLTQHRLRATFATLHAEAGTPITEIQGMLGHKDITTTMIYVEQSLGAKRKAQDALSKQLGLA